MTDFIDAELLFLDCYDGKPTAYGRQREKDNLPLVKHTVRIENLRGSQEVLCLDKQGFTVVKHRSDTEDFLSQDSLNRTYLPELEILIRELTGAQHTVALGSSVVRRSERSTGYLAPGTSVPGRFVHCDYSQGPDGSLYWLNRVLEPHEAASRQHRRYAIYNVWRALSAPPHDSPIALCDVQSLKPEDCVAANCVCDPEGEPEWSFENTLYHYGAHQRWAHISDLQRDEALIFKGFDSDSDRAQGVPHAAFNDPNSPVNGPARESIDERVIAFF